MFGGLVIFYCLLFHDLTILSSARGNTSLGSTYQLTQELKKDINTFDEKIEELTSQVESNGSAKRRQAALHTVQEYINDLLFRIEEAIPLISLALTTSGANLSSRMPDSVSPGRFLQAGNYLRKADERFESLMDSCKDPSQVPIRVQVGPAFTLVLYTIFYGAMRNPHLAKSSDIMWKEEHARCQVKLWRVNDLGAVSFETQESSSSSKPKGTSLLSDFSEQLEYQYVMTIDESFKDGRYHEKDEKPSCRAIDISAVTRLFFSASGKLLQIEESKSPVLVLKLNAAFDPMRNMTTSRKSRTNENGEDSETASETELSDPEDESFIYEQNHEHLAAGPEHVEWLAFEQYSAGDDLAEEDLEDELEASVSSSEEEDYDESDRSSSRGLSDDLKSLRLSDQSAVSSSPLAVSTPSAKLGRHTEGRGSLSLLEYLVRISALQSNDQESIYSIHDERIALYLRDESATGAATSTAPSSSIKDSPVGTHSEAPDLPRNRRRSNLTPGGSSARKPQHMSRGEPGSSRSNSLQVTPGTPSQFPVIPPGGGGGGSRNEIHPQSQQPRSSQPQRRGKDEKSVSTPLTPWEKDRLKTRRQLLLLRKGSTQNPLMAEIGKNLGGGNRPLSSASSFTDSPISKRVAKNIAAAAAVASATGPAAAAPAVGARSKSELKSGEPKASSSLASVSSTPSSWAASQRQPSRQLSDSKYGYEDDISDEDEDDESLYVHESPLKLKSSRRPRS